MRKNDFGQKKWAFARFYFKSDQAETLEPCGFAGSLPTFPLFFLIYFKKVKYIKNYINVKNKIYYRKKWAFDQNLYFIQKERRINMNEHLWQFVMQVDPFVKYDEVEEIKELNEWDLLITFANGRKVLFDRYTGYYKNVYYDNVNELTEEQEKREYAYRLRSLMGREGVSQEELANRVKTYQSAVSNYVSGKVTPNVIMARKIAKALGYSIDDFFDADY